MTLYVGAEKAVYHVHEDLLFAASPVFKIALSGRFVESNTRSMELPDDDVEIMEPMLQWLYTKQFKHRDAAPSEASSSAYFFELAKLNTVADK